MEGRLGYVTADDGTKILASKATGKIEVSVEKPDGKTEEGGAELMEKRLAIEPPPLEAVVEALAAFLMPSVREAAGDQSNS